MREFLIRHFPDAYIGGLLLAIAVLMALVAYVGYVTRHQLKISRGEFIFILLFGIGFLIAVAVIIYGLATARPV